VEASVIGFALVLFAVFAGRWVAEAPSWSHVFTLSGVPLALALIVYGYIASVLPVWLLLAPRDYLISFIKAGAIFSLAAGILLVRPQVLMPPLTRFIDGTGPVFAGKIFPFCFITIACGAISGFHSLISSGTTPKMILREGQARFIGYGAMMLESFVGIMAMVAACAMTPGVYFAINSPAGIVGHTAEAAAATINGWGYPLDAQTMTHLARDVGEQTLLNRTGGAPSLAVGMAQIFSSTIGGGRLLGIWYHFAIMFEALVVATTILMKMGRLRWIWVTMIPMAALIIITMTASYQKIFSPNPRIGFLSGANELAAEISSGAVAAARVAETHRLMFNLRLDAAV